MRIACLILLLTGAYPLVRGWLATRLTSLIHAYYWTLGSWVGWLAAVIFADTPTAAPAWSYLALCLTGCAGVAVLGARRPGVTAWNFVVLALLAVDLLPLVQGLLRSQGSEIDVFHRACVAATIAVGILNYLPTRLGPAVCLLALGLGLVTSARVQHSEPSHEWIGYCMVALVPWLAYAVLKVRPSGLSEFDSLWQTFRDSFGLVWGQRLREQFNRAAAHAGWPVTLGWRGLRPAASTPEASEPLATLHALMKRFGTEEDRQSAGEQLPS